MPFVVALWAVRSIWQLYDAAESQSSATALLELTVVRVVFAALLFACLLAGSPAHACTETVVAPCPIETNFLKGIRSIKISLHRVSHSAGQVLGGRPAGCPHAFCGCGASLHLFGKIIPALNLAANWLRFPRAIPAPKMAAVRRHHVFVLEQHLGGSIWLAFDANSGHHRTRLHPRSIAGYAIVNPRA